jgi:hypothetical protein
MYLTILQNKPLVRINREKTGAKFPIGASDIATNHASYSTGLAYREFDALRANFQHIASNQAMTASFCVPPN